MKLIRNRQINLKDNKKKGIYLPFRKYKIVIIRNFAKVEFVMSVRNFQNTDFHILNFSKPHSQENKSLADI